MMKESYFARNRCRHHIFCYYGATNDLFVDESLLPLSISQSLHRELKLHGYERIIFFDYVKGVTFLDAESRERWNGQPQSEPEPDMPLVASRIKTKGSLLMNNAAAVRQDSKSYESPVKTSITVSAVEMLHYAEHFMTDVSMATAIIFEDGLNALKLFHEEGKNGSMLNALFKAVADLTSDPRQIENRNVMLFLFNCGNQKAKDVLKGQEWEYTWTHLEELHALTHFISAPTDREVRLALNYQRIRGYNGQRLQVDVDKLDKISHLICTKIKRNWAENGNASRSSDPDELTAATLSDAMRHLYQRFIRPGRMLDLDASRQICRQSDVRPAMEQLRDLIGMENLKNTVAGFIQYSGRNLGEKPEPGLRLEPPVRQTSRTSQNLNFVFTGNPGTGKSTAAVLLGEILSEHGLLSSGHTIKTSPGKMIGQHIGESEANTRALIEQALGGVLFIDEAYEMLPPPDYSNDYKSGIMTVLVDDTESHMGEFSVVMAGYPDQMRELMDKGNKGLKSRFNNWIHIDDYSPEELAQIFHKMARDENLAVSEELSVMLPSFFENWYNESANEWGNARVVRNLINDMTKALRDEHLLTPALIPEKYRAYASNKREMDAEQRLSELVGLKNVKEQIRDFRLQLQYEKEQLRNHHFVFMGNPGTGKTSVAKLYGMLLKGAGVLKSGKVTSVMPEELLKKPYEFDKLVSRCKGGVLFIDEAYQLLNTVGGKSIIEQLLTYTEREYPDPLCVIVAGYEDRMREFVQSNDGNFRRYEAVYFDTYSPEELLEILKRRLAATDRVADEGFLNAALENFYTFHDEIAKRYNAGYIDLYLERATRLLFRRLDKTYGKDCPKEIVRTFRSDDAPTELAAAF